MELGKRAYDVRVKLASTSPSMMASQTNTTSSGSAMLKNLCHRWALPDVVVVLLLHNLPTLDDDDDDGILI